MLGHGWDAYFPWNNRWVEAPLPRISFWQSGGMYVSATAFEALGSPKFVKLHYNLENNQMAIEPINEKGPGALTIKKAREYAPYWLVHIVGFTKRFDISLAKSRTYHPQVMENKCLIVDLSRPEVKY